MYSRSTSTCRRPPQAPISINLNYTGYPSTGVTPYPNYPDPNGSQQGVACTYPGIGGSVALTSTFLSTLLTNCPIAFSNQYAVPVYANQVGLPTLTPDALTYLDQTLGTIKGLGIGFFVWVYHVKGGSMSLWDGTNSGSSGDDGAYYQATLTSSWIPKGGTYSCMTINYHNTASSTCGDFITTVSNHF